MDKALNRFARLRYKDGATVTDKEEISARKLSKETGLSTGLISKLEKESIEDYREGVSGTVPPCSTDTLKRYHDYFGCSYEYLMGETAHKTPEYYNMGKDPLLGLFDDSFIDNLKELLKDRESQDFNVFMLHVFMSDPKRLHDFMETVFRYLYDIDMVNQMGDIRKPDKERMTAPYWFSLYSIIKEYFEALVPNMENGFRQYEQRQTDERAAFEEQIKSSATNVTTPVAVVSLQQDSTDNQEQS